MLARNASPSRGLPPLVVTFAAAGAVATPPDPLVVTFAAPGLSPALVVAAAAQPPPISPALETGEKAGPGRGGAAGVLGSRADPAREQPAREDAGFNAAELRRPEEHEDCARWERAASRSLAESRDTEAATLQTVERLQTELTAATAQLRLQGGRHRDVETSLRAELSASRAELSDACAAGEESKCEVLAVRAEMSDLRTALRVNSRTLADKCAELQAARLDLHAAQSSAESMGADQVLLQGDLWKSSSKDRTSSKGSWQLRMFKLVAPAGGGPRKLQYYKDDATRPKGELLLVNATAHFTGEQAWNGSAQHPIFCVDTMQRCIFLYAKGSDPHAWIDAVNDLAPQPTRRDLELRESRIHELGNMYRSRVSRQKATLGEHGAWRTTTIDV